MNREQALQTEIDDLSRRVRELEAERNRQNCELGDLRDGIERAEDAARAAESRAAEAERLRGEAEQQAARLRGELEELSAIARADNGELWSDECERARKDRDEARAKLAEAEKQIDPAYLDRQNYWCEKFNRLAGERDTARRELAVERERRERAEKALRDAIDLAEDPGVATVPLGNCGLLRKILARGLSVPPSAHEEPASPARTAEAQRRFEGWAEARELRIGDRWIPLGELLAGFDECNVEIVVRRLNDNLGPAGAEGEKR